MEENSEINLFSRKFTKRKCFSEETKLFARKYFKRKPHSSLVSCSSLKLVGDDDIDCYVRKSEVSKDSYEMALVKLGLGQEGSVENNGVDFEKQDLENVLISSEPTSSKSVECDSSASDSEDLEVDEGYQTSDVADGENSKLKTSSYNTFTDTNIEYGGYDMAYGEYLKSFGEDFDITKELFNFGYIDLPDEDEIGLVDVHLTVNTSYRAENVPLVCLTSKLDGKSVLGHPVEIEDLTDLDEEEGSRLDSLVWKTSRRTPVCYGKNSVYSVSEYLKIQFKMGRTLPNACCVPVERIFSKILAGVAQV